MMSIRRFFALVAIIGVVFSTICGFRLIAQADPGASPLSGLPGGAGRPVVMVKFGNAKPDRPHYGLNQADLIYIEEVEWGLTRVAALFNSKFPTVVGPMRSARISDLEILQQFTDPGLAYSGANDVLLKAVRKSNAISLSPSERPNYYYRNLSKEAPNNQLLRLALMMGKETKVGAVKDIGLVFDANPATGGTETKSFKASWPSAKVSGTWNGKSWTISFDGTIHRDAVTKSLLTPKTVILQYVEQQKTKYGDRFGGKTPLVKTIGAGRAIILRNGQSFEGEWSRPIAESGTTFTVGGAQFAFDVGQVLIVFVNNNIKKGAVAVG